MVITIDGVAASGKSTLAKAVAQKLGCTYIDAGMMFRAVALAVMRDEKKIKIDFRGSVVYLNDRDVTSQLRSREVTKFAAEVGGKREFRDIVYSLEREKSREACLVISGRDSGTAVFPDAQHKFFVDADIDVRAQRRYEDYKEQFSLEQLKEDILKRDQRDIELGSLVKPDGAIEIDNSSTIEEAMDKILSNIGLN